MARRKHLGDLTNLPAPGTSKFTGCVHRRQPSTHGPENKSSSLKVPTACSCNDGGGETTELQDEHQVKAHRRVGFFFKPATTSTTATSISTEDMSGSLYVMEWQALDVLPEEEGEQDITDYDFSGSSADSDSDSTIVGDADEVDCFAYAARPRDFTSDSQDISIQSLSERAFEGEAIGTDTSDSGSETDIEPCSPPPKAETEPDSEQPKSRRPIFYSRSRSAHAHRPTIPSPLSSTSSTSFHPSCLSTPPVVLPPLPPRFAYTHRGLTRSHLLMQKWLWGMRCATWSAHFKSESAYGGLAPASRLSSTPDTYYPPYAQPRLERDQQEFHPFYLPDVMTPTYPRAGDLTELRYPLCARVDRFYAARGIGLWTAAKAVWMFDVHLGSSQSSRSEGDPDATMVNEGVDTVVETAAAMSKLATKPRGTEKRGLSEEEEMNLRPWQFSWSARWDLLVEILCREGGEIPEPLGPSSTLHLRRGQAMKVDTEEEGMLVFPMTITSGSDKTLEEEGYAASFVIDDYLNIDQDDDDEEDYGEMLPQVSAQFIRESDLFAKLEGE